MMKKKIFVTLIAGFVINGIFAEQSKQSIKRKIYLCDIRDYENRKDKELPNELDDAMIFTLNVGEEVVEVSTFKDATFDDSLYRLGFIQCYDFPNEISVIVANTTRSKNVLNCETVQKYFEEYLKIEYKSKDEK